MRTNIAIWWILTGFFFLAAAGYTTWHAIAYWDGSFVTSTEWVGTTALLFGAFFAGFIAFFVWWWHRAQGGELPEDSLEAGIDDGETEQGEFSPWSWWPLVLACAPAVGVISLATAHFLIPLAVGLLLVGLVGWVYEYYRGNFAR